MNKQDPHDAGCKEWHCPDCDSLNFTCQAEDNDFPYVCVDCGAEFELDKSDKRL
ncbi:hypothetical protein LCGC14_0657780 [marine sediment metagenome]|uniref:Uncharacterized protein n=1 Tax=marine sediment metagenome TaxID=412755 RepID=A0A0F9QZK4_9ZZZZ